MGDLRLAWLGLRKTQEVENAIFQNYSAQEIIKRGLFFRLESYWIEEMPSPLWVPLCTLNQIIRPKLAEEQKGGGRLVGERCEELQATFLSFIFCLLSRIVIRNKISKKELNPQFWGSDLPTQCSTLVTVTNKRDAAKRHWEKRVCKIC